MWHYRTRSKQFFSIVSYIIALLILLQPSAVNACLLCPDRDTAASLYNGNVVLRIRTGRQSPVEEVSATSNTNPQSTIATLATDTLMTTTTETKQHELQHSAAVTHSDPVSSCFLKHQCNLYGSITANGTPVESFANYRPCDCRRMSDCVCIYHCRESTKTVRPSRRDDTYKTCVTQCVDEQVSWCSKESNLSRTLTRI